MIYIDSNIFIYATINNDEIGEQCRDFLRKVAEKEIKASTSFLTWDEVVYSIRKNKGKEIADKEGEKLLKFPNIEFIKVESNIMSKAQEVMIKYNLKPRDSIHAATAITKEINQIKSDDSDFDKIKELKRISP